MTTIDHIYKHTVNNNDLIEVITNQTICYKILKQATIWFNFICNCFVSWNLWLKGPI